MRFPYMNFGSEEQQRQPSHKYIHAHSHIRNV